MILSLEILDDIAEILSAHISSELKIVTNPQTGEQRYEQKWPGGLSSWVADVLEETFEEVVLKSPPPALALKLADKKQLEEDIRAAIRPTIQAA